MNRFWSVLAPLPVVAMSEDENAYRVSAELPGYQSDEVQVSVSGNDLIVEDVHRHFRRIVHMPPFIDRDAIHADLSDGKLTVTLPKHNQPIAALFPSWCC